MTVNLAINGFGRIGRNILRALVESGRTDLRVVAINDLTPLSTSALLLERDTVHGRFPAQINIDENTLKVGETSIHVTAQRDPSELPWGELNVDIVLECTGFFRARDKAALHLQAGARRVLISAPGKEVDATIVYGVNHDTLEASHHIVSNASCSTNCLAPLAHVLHNAFGLKRGFMTTIHSYTASQNLLDRGHKDPRRARAAAENIIPTTTGAARAVGLVLPALAGKLDGMSIRVPTPNVSAIDFTFETRKSMTPQTIFDAVQTAADGPLSGVLGLSAAPLVSRDFNHDPRSCIVDADQTRVLDSTMGRVLAWYDNEWGFSNRMLDTAAAMGQLI
ncbi:type I glyceraldehyde-3-phosphate dehydrogenase [Roseovarius sp. 2305UL8-3]|uniref:type I glyceraldehyde-3-phosphate dehydrogenase n=1 Tax=Roseovarius conchicola TaxID=3121636 RepID=UPI003528D37E